MPGPLMSIHQYLNTEVEKLLESHFIHFVQVIFHKKRLIFYLIIGSVSTLLSSEFRIFTDIKGRQMEAKLIRVSGEDVYIERKDGMSAKVNLSIFSEADQAYIEKWAQNALLESGVFDVRFRHRRTGENEYREGGVIYNEYNMHYDVVITNEDYDNDFKDIRVEYLILKFEDELAADKRRDGVIHRIKGSVSYPMIKAREEVRLSTEKFRMLKTQLSQGYVWRGGGQRDSEDVAKGIWVKIYVGDKLTHELSKPENMRRKEPWN